MSPLWEDFLINQVGWYILQHAIIIEPSWGGEDYLINQVGWYILQPAIIIEPLRGYILQHAINIEPLRGGTFLSTRWVGTFSSTLSL